MIKRLILACLVGLTLFSTSCRENEVIFLPTPNQVAPPHPNAKVMGFYQLNEGNMGMNRASIDFFDIREGVYTTDIYSKANPSVVKELGDVGNDIRIYGDKLYAVINCSNKVEVMDRWTCKRIKVINIPNCRYIVFNEGKAYVSSYSGPVEINPNAEKGFIAEIDTASLEITRTVGVGYQPEEMVINNGKLYVANSGGYRVPNYDNTVSVVDLESFTQINKIPVGINLHRMALDKRGNIFVSSRGDYYDVPSNLFVIDSHTDLVTDTLGIAASELHLSGDSLYYYSVEWSYHTNTNNITFGILDTRTKEVVNDKIITDGTDKNMMIPYGIAVNPESKDIYISDAQNYVVTGYIYCYSAEGKMKWRVEAGNIPGHFTFLTNETY